MIYRQIWLRREVFQYSIDKIRKIDSLRLYKPSQADISSPRRDNRKDGNILKVSTIRRPSGLTTADIKIIFDDRFRCPETKK